MLVINIRMGSWKLESSVEITLYQNYEEIVSDRMWLQTYVCLKDTKLNFQIPAKRSEFNRNSELYQVIIS